MSTPRASLPSARVVEVGGLAAKRVPVTVYAVPELAPDLDLYFSHPEAGLVSLTLPSTNTLPWEQVIV